MTLSQKKCDYAVIYARVSSREQEREGYSIDAQLKLLREFAQNKSFVVVQEFQEAESAKCAGRRRFNEMLKFIEVNPGVTHILCEKTDRLSRNFRDIATLDSLINERGVVIHLVKENQTLARNSRPSEKLAWGMQALIAKNYIDNLSEEVRKGMQEKAEQGEFPCGKVPVGYLRDRDTGQLVIDPLRAPFIRQMFEHYSERRKSLRGLVKWTKTSGLVMPRSGKSLTLAQVERTLKNPIYVGEFQWAGKRYQGKHDPMISRELFARTQQAFQTNNKPFDTRRQFAFSNLLTCAVCGCKVVAEMKKGKYVYYHCTGMRGGCKLVYLKEERLADQLGELVRQISIAPELAKQILGNFEKRYSARRNESVRIRQGIQLQLGRIRQWTEEAYTDKLEGRISESHWQKLTLKWEADAVGLQGQLKALTLPSGNAVHTLERILELSQKLPALWLKRNNFERRQILDFSHSNFLLNGTTVSATIRKPLNLLAEGPGCLIKRG